MFPVIPVCLPSQAEQEPSTLIIDSGLKAYRNDAILRFIKIFLLSRVQLI